MDRAALVPKMLRTTGLHQSISHTLAGRPFSSGWGHVPVCVVQQHNQVFQLPNPDHGLNLFSFNTELFNTNVQSSDRVVTVTWQLCALENMVQLVPNEIRRAKPVVWLF